MNKQTEALRLALAALEIYGARAPDVEETITAIREALAEQPAQQQEPVAWEGDRAYHEGRSEYENSVRGFRFGKHSDFWELTSIKQAEWVAKAAKRLYTSPPQRHPWVGLTDDEFQFIYAKETTPAGMMEMVEAKLKEKNA